MVRMDFDRFQQQILEDSFWWLKEASQIAIINSQVLIKTVDRNCGQSNSFLCNLFEKHKVLKFEAKGNDFKLRLNYLKSSKLKTLTLKNLSKCCSDLVQTGIFLLAKAKRIRKSKKEQKIFLKLLMSSFGHRSIVRTIQICNW